MRVEWTISLSRPAVIASASGDAWSEAESPAHIHHRNDLAGEINDSQDDFGRLGERGDLDYVDDPFHRRQADGIIMTVPTKSHHLQQSAHNAAFSTSQRRHQAKCLSVNNTFAATKAMMVNLHGKAQSTGAIFLTSSAAVKKSKRKKPYPATVLVDGS